MNDTPRSPSAGRDAPLVLIVDDARDGRESCADYLSFHGYTVAMAEDGEEALDMTRDLLPDVILMDISLPGMDGLEATSLLKRDEKTRDIPVIAVTAHALHDTRDEALAAGCSEVVTKPYEPRELEAAIRDLLEGAPASSSGEDSP